MSQPPKYKTVKCTIGIIHRNDQGEKYQDTLLYQIMNNGHHSVVDSMMPGFFEDTATPLRKSVFCQGPS